MLRSKVAIITGAGRGIGRAIALAYADAGADLTVVSRTLAEVEETANQVRARGRRAVAMAVDVANRDDVAQMTTAAIREFGHVDILVNDAGVLGPVGPLWASDPDEWIRAVEVNLIGTYYCCRAVLPHMIGRRQGRIINLSGGGATSPRAFFSAYAASKTAVVRLTETLAEEVAAVNVQVNAVAPGPVNTRLLDQTIAAGELAGGSAQAQARRQSETGGVPPEVPAALALFLASDASAGLTGRLISAVWDDWRGLVGRIPEVMASDLYTLRRTTPSRS